MHIKKYFTRVLIFHEGQYFVNLMPWIAHVYAILDYASNVKIDTTLDQFDAMFYVQ